MDSRHRTRACLSLGLGKRWRTTVCSCLQSRLLLLLMALYILHCSQSQAKPYSHNQDTTYYTFRCNESWCGEKWSNNRILRYGYNVTDKLEVETTVQTVHKNNCSGAQDSADCVTNTVVTNDTGTVRVKNIHRFEEPEITKIPEANLYLITTDNINGSNVISDTYNANQDKIWQIRVPDGCKMTLYFSQFDLQASEQCQKDSFSVQTRHNQLDIYRYCHSDLNYIEIRRRKRVQMTFHADSIVQHGGIRATACISDLHDPTSEEELSLRHPCTCTGSSSRRRKKKSPSNRVVSLRKKIAAEELRIARWLDTLMQGGQTAVDEFLENPEDHKQRHLAEQYQELLDKHRDW